MADIEKTLALWCEVNRTISELGEHKKMLAPSEYRELVDRAYTQKRIVGALLRSLQPLPKDYFRVPARTSYA